MDRRENYESLSDLELIDAINEGNEAAFEALYHRHRDWAANLACRWTDDRDLALDVLQETFCYLAGKFPGFRLTAKLQTFLFPVIRNLSLTMRRKSGAYRPMTEAGSQPDPPVDGNPRLESEENLQTALRALNEGQRDVLLLRFVDDLNLEEIAEVLGIPAGTVKSRLHNALQALRRDAHIKEYFQ